MGSVGEARVVGAFAFCAEPAAFEEGADDVAPVADDVHCRAAGYARSAADEEEARLGRLLDAAQVRGEAERSHDLEHPPQPCRRLASGSRVSSGIADLSGFTSPRSTRPGCAPSELPRNVVPDRGEPTTKTSRSSRWSDGRERAR